MGFFLKKKPVEGAVIGSTPQSVRAEFLRIAGIDRMEDNRIQHIMSTVEEILDDLHSSNKRRLNEMLRHYLHEILKDLKDIDEDLRRVVKFCGVCSKKVPHNAKICPHCGEKFPK